MHFRTVRRKALAPGDTIFPASDCEPVHGVALQLTGFEEAYGIVRRGTEAGAGEAPPGIHARGEGSAIMRRKISRL